MTDIDQGQVQPEPTPRTPPHQSEPDILPNMARIPAEQRIQDRLDRAAISGQAVDMSIGGVRFNTMVEVMEFAKLMSMSGSAVPAFLRQNPGGCLAICSRALRWRMDPFAVAEKSYQVNNKGQDRIAYESQLIHAVIEAHAPISHRLRYVIEGKDDDRTITVWSRFRGESVDIKFKSSTLGESKARIGFNAEKNTFRGSPLWITKPEVQMFYDASRDWCRINCPDVLLGIYSVDEMIDHGWADRTDTPFRNETTGLLDRLRSNNGTAKGFDNNHVQETVKSLSAPAGAAMETVRGNTREPVPERTSRPQTRAAKPRSAARSGGSKRR